jgi:hypothetical protein
MAKLCPREIVFTIPGAPGVTVTGTEDGAGNLDFTATVNATAQLTGDLGGIFFQFNDAKLSGLQISGPQVTTTQISDDQVINLGNGINMNGNGVQPFDVGIQFGQGGIGNTHQDIQSTSWVLSDPLHNLTLDDVAHDQFGARVTSIGAPGGSRSGSEKITAIAPEAPKASDASVTTPEDVPITIPLTSAIATDSNGSPMHFDDVSQGKYGTVTISPDGQSLIYTPTTLDYEVNGVLVNSQDSFQYCVTDALGGTDSATINVTGTPVADQPSITITNVAPGPTALDTLVTFTASSGDAGTPTAGSDFLQSLMLGLTGNVGLGAGGINITDTAGAFNQATGAFTLPGGADQFSDTLDIAAPTSLIGSTFSLNDLLNFTTVGAETEDATKTAQDSASQPLQINFGQASLNPDFTTQDQNMWGPGAAFKFDFSKFLGISKSGGPVTLGGHFKTKISPLSVFLASASGSASIGLKLGLQAGLHINGGSFNADLPFNVNLNEIHNITTDTLETQSSQTAQTGSLDTTGPNGNASLQFVFDAMAKLAGHLDIAGLIKTGFNFHTGFNFTTGISVSSGNLHTSFNLGPATINLTYPQVNTHGTGTNSISASGSKPAVNVSLDAVDLVLTAIFGDDPLKGTLIPDILKYDLLSANLGVGLNLEQEFNLSDSGLNATLSAGTGNQLIPGFDVNGTTLIQNVSSLGLSGGAVPLSLDFALNNPTLQNHTNLVPAFTGSLTVGQISIPPIKFTTAVFKTNFNVPLAHIPVPGSTTFPAAFAPQTINTLGV